MTFNLLTSLNESALETETHQALLESIISEHFGDDAASSVDECAALWDMAQDNPKKTTIVEQPESAAMARAGELDWVRSTAQDNKQKQAVKNKALGIKPKGTPETGHMVVMQGGLGKIVATQPEDRKLIIQNKAGVEKVFSYDQLVGPKKVNGKLAWALKGTVAN